MKTQDTTCKMDFQHMPGASQKNDLEMMSNIFKKEKITNSLEVGFGYGSSTIAILKMLPMNGAHISIDPLAGSWENNLALDIAKKDTRFSFLSLRSDEALVGLRDKHKFDFIYIDGDHRFDYVMNDFFLSDAVLKIGGIIQFDDCLTKEVRKVLKYIVRNRLDYEVYDYTESENRMIAFLQRPVNQLLSLFNYFLPISGAIAFKKKRDDFSDGRLRSAYKGF